VNGKWVGCSKDSFLGAEFDVTDALRLNNDDDDDHDNGVGGGGGGKGKCVKQFLALRVMQWSDGSYLEDQVWKCHCLQDASASATSIRPELLFSDYGVLMCFLLEMMSVDLFRLVGQEVTSSSSSFFSSSFFQQDQWWLSGLHRSVELHCLPSVHIHDLNVTSAIKWPHRPHQEEEEEEVEETGSGGMSTGPGGAAPKALSATVKVRGALSSRIHVCLLNTLLTMLLLCPVDLFLFSERLKFV
jgi:hypothetical protein